jgi:hypothetical protein
MGRDDDPMAVLDSHCRVRGVVGLRVVDAGAMPTITSGNTNSPTLMMAEKVTRWVLDGQQILGFSLAKGLRCLVFHSTRVIPWGSEVSLVLQFRHSFDAASAADNAGTEETTQS